METKFQSFPKYIESLLLWLLKVYQMEAAVDKIAATEKTSART